MIFAQMLEIVALSDLASVLCARKFSFAPQVGDVPQITRFLAVEAYGFMLVRVSVRPSERAPVRLCVTACLENYAPDFLFFFNKAKS